MKNSKQTGVNPKEKIDYFEHIRNSKPLESYGVEEFREKIEKSRKEKAHNQSK